MSSDANIVTWALTKDPRLGRVAYTARSRCPHGEVATYVFARVEMLREAGPQLAAAHVAQTECACSMGPLAVDGVPFPFDEEGPDRVV